jgi:ppGpp synthetase/RelA/SpoT-type nucleotidyltranferase
MSEDLTNKQIQNLGKRLRDGVGSAHDISLLNQYRAKFDPLLFDTAEKVTLALDAAGIRHLISGRTKRTKSIIRKLIRDPAMDLSRMIDIVGIRVIVPDMHAQDKAIDLISRTNFARISTRDYRSREAGYRAVHLHVMSPSASVEIQVRTLAQHFWADQSERLGERVKEGLMNDAAKEVLDELFVFCVTRDMDAATSNRFSARQWEEPYQRMADNFDKFESTVSSRSSFSFVVLYDAIANLLLKVDTFSKRDEAIAEFRYLSNQVDEERFDVLVLNSATRESLSITHPRFFPEG